MGTCNSASLCAKLQFLPRPHLQRRHRNQYAHTNNHVEPSPSPTPRHTPLYARHYVEATNPPHTAPSNPTSPHHTARRHKALQALQDQRVRVGEVTGSGWGEVVRGGQGQGELGQDGVVGGVWRCDRMVAFSQNRTRQTYAGTYTSRSWSSNGIPRLCTSLPGWPGCSSHGKGLRPEMQTCLRWL